MFISRGLFRFQGEGFWVLETSRGGSTGNYGICRCKAPNPQAQATLNPSLRFVVDFRWTPTAYRLRLRA